MNSHHICLFFDVVVIVADDSYVDNGFKGTLADDEALEDAVLDTPLQEPQQEQQQQQQQLQRQPVKFEIYFFEASFLFFVLMKRFATLQFFYFLASSFTCPVDLFRVVTLCILPRPAFSSALSSISSIQ